MNIQLQDWASRHFDPPPGIRTVRNWVRAGLIRPAPIKVGRSWYVDEDARYCPHATPAEHEDDVVAGIWNEVEAA